MRYTLRTEGIRRDLEIDTETGPVTRFHLLLQDAQWAVRKGEYPRTPTGPFERVGWDTPAALAEALSLMSGQEVEAVIDGEPVEMPPLDPPMDGAVY